MKGMGKIVKPAAGLQRQPENGAWLFSGTVASMLSISSAENDYFVSGTHTCHPKPRSQS